MAITALTAADVPASAQFPRATRSDADEEISIMVAGDAVIWAHRSTLYSARAPEYRPTRLSSMVADEWETGWGSARSVSPDGAWILYLRDGLLYRLPAAGGAVAAETSRVAPVFETTGVITNAAWSPDGSRIAFVMAAPKARWLPEEAAASVPSFVGIFDLKTGRRWFLSPSLQRDASPVWTPDGGEVFFQRRTRTTYAKAIPAAAGPGQGWRAAAVGDDDAPGITSCLMVGEVEFGEVRVLWTDA